MWVLDPADAVTLKRLHHAPSAAFYPFVDSAGRVIFTNWDHLSRDTQAVTDSRDAGAKRCATCETTAHANRRDVVIQL